MSADTSAWRRFWDRPHRIYANARHRDFHYRRIAEQLIAQIPNDRSVVLDYGCGEALHADLVAATCGRLILTDSSPSVRAGLSARFAAHPTIRVESPDAIAAGPAARFDLIVMASVAQYMRRDELTALAAMFLSKLVPGGRLILADVIPPDVSMAEDIRSLLRTARDGGFLMAAVIGLVATFFSDYRRLRREVGLTCYTDAEMLTLLARAGFEAHRNAVNLYFHPGRASFIATRPR